MAHAVRSAIEMDTYNQYNTITVCFFTVYTTYGEQLKIIKLHYSFNLLRQERLR